ncbi:MAG: PfkB family carbohydrate kinase [Clostridium beijerinckii]
MLKVIGIGDNVCDKYKHIGKMFPGGQALNFAVYCKQHGNLAAYMGVFGNDEVANHIIKILNKLKIDISHSRHYQGENGYAVIDLKDGDRVFITSNKGGMLRSYPIRFSEEDLEYVSEFDIIHTSNNSYIDNELSKLAKLKNKLSYDFSTAWKDEKRTKKICGYIDFGFLSCSDIDINEIKEFAKKMNAWGCGLIVATMGSRGAIAFDGETYFTIKPKLVKAIDTLGAGDSFAAGFLMSYMEKIEKSTVNKKDSEYPVLFKFALESGAKLSAQTCLKMGAFGYECDIE